MVLTKKKMIKVRLIFLLILSLSTFAMSIWLSQRDPTYNVFLFAATFVAIFLFSISLNKPRLLWLLGIHWKYQYFKYLLWCGMTENSAVNHINRNMKSLGYFTLKQQVSELFKHSPDMPVFKSSDFYKVTVL